jgi:putative membrane protein
MDRRGLLVGFSILTATADIALAQTKLHRDEELQHALSMMSYGAAALDIAKLGVSKAANEDVRIFAQDEVAEQESLAEVLRSIMGDSHSVEPPQTAKIDMKGWISKLRDIEGSDFDRLFVDDQLGVHKEMLQAQTSFLSRSQDKWHRALASIARSHIVEHTGRLARLRQMLG